MERKRTATLIAVLKRILFIGFSVQIILGLIWMGGNFAHVQDFPEPEANLYNALLGVFGECVPLHIIN